MIYSHYFECISVMCPVTFPCKAFKFDEHLAAKIPMWRGSDCIGFMQLNLKLLHWVLRVAKNFMGGSEGTIYSRYFECISVMFPVTFPIIFHFRLHNSDTSVGSQ